ncbi:MAG: addiction module protein [Bifidobacteriaceae bacterium]|jgi:putative addiction module component (TIGR02574 family)|nr:addiction module protein [Bifidobacteriaceae bacterium]
MVPKAIMDEALALDDYEKLKLIDALQRSLDPSLDDEISPEEAALVDERMADFRANPEEGIPFEEVIAEMRSLLA